MSLEIRVYKTMDLDAITIDFAGMSEKKTQICRRRKYFLVKISSDLCF